MKQRAAMRDSLTSSARCGNGKDKPPVSKFSGVVQCDTLIANSVAAANYPPGAGNIL